MTRTALPLLLCLCAACGGASPYVDPAQPIEVEAGDDFKIRLDANHSTGYEWVLVDTAALGVLRPAGRRYVVPRRSRNADGAGGTETWSIWAPTAGSGVVSLIYVRPDEGMAPPDTIRFRVTVRE